MSERARNVSPIFFGSDGRWRAPGAEFPRGTVEIEALITGVLLARGDRWETLWEWNGIPHIYDHGIWQQHERVDEWTLRLYGDDEPLVPGRYRLTLWRNGEIVAQGHFLVRGPAPPAGGRLDLGQIELYQHQGRHLLPCQTRRCLAQALGVTLIYRDLPQGALVHAVWYCNGRLAAVENRNWHGPKSGEELLFFVADTQYLQPGQYELWVSCWPEAPLYRSISYHL